MSGSVRVERSVFYPLWSDRLARCEAAATGIAIAVLLLLFQVYLQNVHIATTNGLWKSIVVRRWIAHSSWQLLDDANVLYFPIQMLSCELLERLGIFPGQIWRQLAVLNGIAGGAGATAVYLFTLRWLQSRPAALLATVLYAGSGFYLLLSVIDEDIMPGAVLVLIATLLACAWFAQPNPRRIFIVALVFTLGWLWEWRLIFPTLPAMLLALFIARGRLGQRFSRPAWFIAAMFPTPLLIAALFRLERAGGDHATLGLIYRMFWAGKAVGTGWGGFTWRKVMFAWVGMTESILGARNVSDWDVWLSPPIHTESLVASAILVALAVILCIYAWRRRTDPIVVNAAAILGGTLLAGTVFNLYSQPQDPQMVINVMIWTVPAWGLIACGIVGTRPASHVWRRSLTMTRPLLILAALAPTAYNVSALAAQRGLDPIWEGLARSLEQCFAPSRTVYLYQGFEGIITWQSVLEQREYAGTDSLHAPAPANQHFKWIDATTPTIMHPAWSAEQVAMVIKRSIDAALDLDYQVVAGPAYLAPEQAWAGSFATVARPDVPQAIYAMIATNYVLKPAFTDPHGGTYAILTRRAAQ